MAPSKEHLQQALDFIKQHRSNEANFPQIAEKINEELKNTDSSTPYHAALTEISEKHLPAYTKAQQNGGTAWPEFENFVAEFEQSLTNELKNLH